MDTLIETLMSQLPHGSGINCDWTAKIKGQNLCLSNSYHCMNEAGYYDGWQDFTIIIPLETLFFHTYEIADNFKLQFNNGNWNARKYDLRPYLEDILAEALHQW